MLKVSQDGIELSLKPTPPKAVFWGGLGLLLLGVAVVGLLVWASSTVALVGFFVWACLCLGFARYRQKLPLLPTQAYITPHTLSVDGKVYHTKDFGVISTDTAICLSGDHVVITLTGFDNPQEQAIAYQVIQGKTIKTQNANIKLQS